MGLFNAGLKPNIVSGVNRKAIFTDFDPAVDVYINENAFALAQPYTFGNSARYYPDFRSFPAMNENMGLLKKIAITEYANLIFRAEFFNVFNRVVLNSPASNMSNSNFGKISGQGAPRIGQLALRLEF